MRVSASKLLVPMNALKGLTLIYLRQFTTFQLLGIQFGVSETTANDTFNYWFPLLGKMLPPSLSEQVKKTPTNTRL